MENNKKISLLSALLFLIRKQVCYAGKKYIFAPLKINHDYKKIDITKIQRIRIAPEILNENGVVNAEYIDSIEEYSKAIYSFIDLLEKKFPKEVLKNFYHNINSIDVIKLRKIIGSNGAIGFYDLFDNFIGLKEGHIGSIYHELFHMASTRNLGSISQCGFAQYFKKNKKTFGVGINEGYTQLMTERYFENDRTEKFLDINYVGYVQILRSYPLQTLIASKLEKIVGKEKMEGLYLRGNLYGMIEELNKYASKEEIKEFIMKVDFLHENIKNVRQFSIRNNKINKTFVEICGFLVNCYNKKITDEHGRSFMHRDSMMKEYVYELEFYYDRYFSSKKKDTNKKR